MGTTRLHSIVSKGRSITNIGMANVTPFGSGCATCNWKYPEINVMAVPQWQYGVGDSGNGWDFVTGVTDITGDGIVPIYASMIASSTPNMMIIRYHLQYTNTVWPSSFVSYRDIQITYSSGHVENFKIPLSIFDPLTAGDITAKLHGFPLGAAWVRPTSAMPFHHSANDYGASALAMVDNNGDPINAFYGFFLNDSSIQQMAPQSIVGGYGFTTFTKYAGNRYSSGSPFKESEIVTKYEGAQRKLYEFYPHSIDNYGHTNLIEHDFGYNSYTALDPLDSGRQEIHRIDVLLQDNNANWRGDFGTRGGNLMDIAQMVSTQTAARANNPATARFKGSGWATQVYGGQQLGPMYSDNDPQVWIHPDGGSPFNAVHIHYSEDSQVTTWSDLMDTIDNTDGSGTASQVGYRFIYSIIYAENLVPPVARSFSFDVCLGIGNPSYYQTTSKDCNGATIPAANLPGGADYAATTFNDGQCCADCSQFLTVSEPSCSAYATNTGAIIIGDGYGFNPAASGPVAPTAFTSGSSYTYTLALSTGASISQTAPPTGGNTVTVANCVTNTTTGIAHQITCPSSALIVPGMLVSGAGIPANVEVQDILTGTAGSNVTKFTIQYSPGWIGPAFATAAATVTLTFSAGISHYWGSLLPNDAAGAGAGSYYIATVTDENGCVNTHNLTICRSTAPLGCTESTAINYDSTAGTDDGSCLLCDATTGKLEDVNGNDVSDIFSSSTITVQDATVDDDNDPQSDGIIGVSATVDRNLQSYISLGATETYTMTLHKITTPGDPSTSTGIVATQAGIASTIFSYSPQNAFNNLSYGHYAAKIQFVDSNNVLEVEECFTWVFATVKVPVCDDSNSKDYNTAVPLDFRISDSTLCKAAGSGAMTCPECYQEPLLIYDGKNSPLDPPLHSNPLGYQSCTGTNSNINSNSSECNPTLVGSFICGKSNASSFPNCPLTQSQNVGTGYYLSPSTLSIVWLFNGAPIPIGFQQTTPSVTGTPPSSPYGNVGIHFDNTGPAFNAYGNQSLLPTSPANSFLSTYGSGTYTLEYWTTLADGTVCVYGEDFVWTMPGGGCMDPAATNYDPNATCPDACIYESWFCQKGICHDPGDGTGTYPTLQVCQLNCLPPPLPGCTDPCAVNYNQAAGIDDGSCEYKACLDPTASNFEYSCDCKVKMPLATINDKLCCTYLCKDKPNVVITTTDATGTCPSGGNSDGCITITQTSTNGATTHDFVITDPAYNVVYEWDDGTGLNTFNPSGTPITYCLLPPGVYIAITVDNLGCRHEETFSIGINAALAGCTDPKAQNYDPTAVCDDGSCIYCGCTDPLADNYNPNAVCDDGTCIYSKALNPCIPKDLKKVLSKINNCLSNKGSKWLSDYKIGTNVDCATLDKWKLILLKYVLKAYKSEQGFGLSCLFNCADNATQDASTLITSCDEAWITGGSYTGIHDAAVAGTTIVTGEGTTVSDPSLFFTASYKLLVGDVIKMPSGLIWKLVDTTTNQIAGGGCTLQNLNPETAIGSTSGSWKQCLSSDYFTITSSVNYYDNFINFVNKYCKDCNIPPAHKQ